jgi:viroplasmin and RNaseH domain-containing protein
MKEEKLRKIAELRETLEKRAKSLETEIEGIQTILDLVNDILLEKSFKRAEEMSSPISRKPSEVKVQPPSPKKHEKTILLETGTGEILAKLYIKDGSMRIVPASNQKFNVKTPPFTTFLIERILAKMREKDQELVRQRKISRDKILSYKIKKEGDILQEITIRNCVPERERELRSATRWTLEKMYEKMNS